MTLLRGLAQLFAWGASAGLAAIGLAGLSGVGHRWIDILAQFTAPAAAGAGLLVLACLGLRLWSAAAAASLAGLILLVAVWPQLAPDRRPAEGPTLRLYTANLYGRNDDVAAMRASLQAADADVLVLIELGDAPSEQIDALLEGWPHRAVSGRRVGAGGAVRSVIASRLPLRPHALTLHEVETVSATVQAPFGPVEVIAVHLTRPWPFQFQWGQIIQVMELGEHRRTLNGPIIAAGDFNSVSTARIGRQMRDELGLTAAPGWPGTWPAKAPGPLRINIDQVYRSPELVVTERRLGRPTGSDHRPVVTELRLRAGG
ncbi:endonuclease [Brevundimonas sp. S30B]|uniref:endonuclease/exonuclease/phosphatase family protein n=1 Tax=unclassified Brevundimonas TaxID=2622653 RepID=UPI001072D775|nr:MULTISPECIES: endonuclease/exonuclease/phosphatase family protein [unclassified Brevundimonas]QBX38603.1 endonuclease [Brevundimonas sp. MF30-B]TFW01194.1 endonuclease [Brevundimonas sp. S30B]